MAQARPVSTPAELPHPTIAPVEAGPAPRCVRPSPADAPPPAAPARSCPPDPTTRPMLPWGAVEIENGARVRVEIAHSATETERGLMYRTALPEDEGMIFAMPRRDHVFWMRNTCVSLDMLFIDRDATIVGIEESVPVLNEASRSVGCPSTHVLEVNAGWSRRHGVKAGMKVRTPLP